MESAAVHRIHCSYHKCLTVYFRRVMDSVFNRCQPWSGGYGHFNSHLQDFLAGFRDLEVASVNNRALDPRDIGPCRISRFLRDPRDLVVSGYFYHRRGAELWTQIVDPTADDWYFAHGVVPEGLRAAGGSFADYLKALPEEDGLLAELEFRTLHFESMARWRSLWGVDHPDVLVLRYEEILGREVESFQRIFRHYGFGPMSSTLGRFFARRHSLAGRSVRRHRADAHVRNPASGQWREHFTPRVRRAFDARWAGLIRQLGYPDD
ncbi:MAG: sulfotransferase domain-containing protein [Acidobacteriota bacterium]